MPSACDATPIVALAGSALALSGGTCDQLPRGGSAARLASSAQRWCNESFHRLTPSSANTTSSSTKSTPTSRSAPNAPSSVFSTTLNERTAVFGTFVDAFGHFVGTQNKAIQRKRTLVDRAQRTEHAEDAHRGKVADRRHKREKRKQHHGKVKHIPARYGRIATQRGELYMYDGPPNK